MCLLLSKTRLNLHTAVLDLLQTEGLHLFVVLHVLALGEAEGVVTVVTGDTALLVPLAVEGDALEPAGDEEDLEPAGGGDHLDGIEGSGSGNVGEGDARGGGEEPGLVGGGMEGVRAGGAEVEGEVDAELLDHEADGGNHGDAAVLELGVLEPLDGVGAGVLEDPGAEGRALVASLDGDAKGIIDRGGGEGRGGLARLSGGRKGGGRAKDGGEAGGGLHLPTIIVSLSTTSRAYRREVIAGEQTSRRETPTSRVVELEALKIAGKQRSSESFDSFD